MAGANLLKKPADWSSLAAGIEVNPDGSGFRLARQTDFFDFTTDEGITWEDNGSGESWGNNAGTLRSANDALELVLANQAQNTRAYKAGFSITADFKLDFEFKGHVGSAFFELGISDTIKFPSTQTGDGTSNSLLAGFRPGVADIRADSWKLGARTTGSVNATTVNATFYATLERIGTTFTAKVYNDSARASLLSTSTLNNVSAATLTTIIFIIAFIGSSNTSSMTLRNFELFNGITDRYLSTSPVATMGVVALPVGTIINGLGDLVEKLDGAAGISPEYNINDAGWVGPFATYAAMDTALNSSPIAIIDDTLSVNVRHAHDSDGSEQAEVFVSEGPNLTGGGVADDKLFGGTLDGF